MPVFRVLSSKRGLNFSDLFLNLLPFEEKV